MLKKNTYTPKRGKTTNPPKPTSNNPKKTPTKGDKPQILRPPNLSNLTKLAKFRHSKRFIAFIMAFMVFATSIALDTFAFGADVIVAINNPVPAFNIDEGGTALVVTGTANSTSNNPAINNRVVNNLVELNAAIQAIGSPTGTAAGASAANPWVIGIAADIHLTTAAANSNPPAGVVSTAGITVNAHTSARHIRLVPMGGNRQITVNGNFRHFGFSGTTHLQIAGNGTNTLSLTRAAGYTGNGGGVVVNTQGIPAAVGNQAAQPATFRLMPGGRITNVQQSGSGGAVLVQGHSQ
ncbi:MAG: hypothetical protein FWG64_11345, partial [Firmicutes bacterium]|nr:hypothetical protein [Bacillota bacterium]